MANGKEVTTTVDLSLSTRGRIKFGHGQEYWCRIMGPEGDDEKRCLPLGEGFDVRIENGVYYTYTRDGRHVQYPQDHFVPWLGRGLVADEGDEANIVEFEPMDASVAKERGLKFEATP